MTLWNLDWDFTERKASQPHAAVMSKDEGKRFRKLSLRYTVPNSQLAENICHKTRIKTSRKLHLETTDIAKKFMSQSRANPNYDGYMLVFFGSIF